MKIVHINTFDWRGGAARAANRLHRGLRTLGQDSTMFVASRETADQHLTVFNPPYNLAGRLRRTLRRRWLQGDQALLNRAMDRGCEIFSDDRNQHGAEPLRQLPDGDIFHLHWVAGFVDYGIFLPGVARRAPLVWTLHDMNPFTGGCHCDENCGRFQDRCGHCPQLDSREETDLASKIWARKREVYEKIAPGRLHVVAPSRWLASEARRSALFRGFPVSIIPYGLDVATFVPRGRDFAREFFGIPKDKHVILCVADLLSRRLKGLGNLEAALEGFKNRADLVVVTLGHGDAFRHLGIRHIPIGYTGDERLASLAYNSADVFVCPSLQDNFPNTILESMSAGVPVVGSKVGGIPDLVREGITGSLVDTGDIPGLRKAILGILEDPIRRAAMGANCRRIAVEEYSLEIQARRYISLYESILAKN